jgi:hypothetical protein
MRIWTLYSDWLTFIASLVSSLAWPVSAIVAIYLLKNNLGIFTQVLERLKFKGLELEFRKGIEESQKNQTLD